MDPAELRRYERVRADLAISFRELDPAESEALGRPGLDGASGPGSLLVPGNLGGGGAGHSENLSLGGLSMTGDLQILGEKRLAKGHRLWVEFHLPGDASDEPVGALAVVAWCLEGNGPHGKFTAGIMFLDIRPADLERIGRYVEAQKA